MSSRLTFLICGLLCGGSVLGALLTQWFLDWQPCVMCVEIRAWLILASACFFIASLLNLNVFHWGLGAIGCLASIAAAIKGGQLFFLERGWVESFNCSPFANFPNWMPLHEWMPFVFQPQAVCGESIRSLIIPLSAWPFMLSAMCIFACGHAMLKKRRK